jgi:transposase-like protein
LIAEINELGYSAVGRKYGVSDNAVRKWLKDYQKQQS